MFGLHCVQNKFYAQDCLNNILGIIFIKKN